MQVQKGDLIYTTAFALSQTAILYRATESFLYTQIPFPVQAYPTQKHGRPCAIVCDVPFLLFRGPPFWIEEALKLYFAFFYQVLGRSIWLCWRHCFPPQWPFQKRHGCVKPGLQGRDRITSGLLYAPSDTVEHSNTCTYFYQRQNISIRYQQV